MGNKSVPMSSFLLLSFLSFIIVAVVMYFNGDGFDTIVSNWHIFVALGVCMLMLLFRNRMIRRVAYLIFTSVVIGVIINGVIF